MLLYAQTDSFQAKQQKNNLIYFNLYYTFGLANYILIDFYYHHFNFKIYNSNNHMMKSFCRLNFFKFSVELQNAYSLKFKVKDVTKLKGMKDSNPYVFIQNKKIQIPPNKIIAHVMAQSPFNKPNELPNIRFLDTQLNIYNPASPTLALLENSFYIKLQNELYYVANKQNLIKNSYNAQFIATDAPQSLEPIVNDALRDIRQIPDYISPSNLHTMLIKNVLDHTLTFKLEKVRLKQLLKIVQSRINQFNNQIESINEIVSKKAINRTRLFSSFMIGQYAIIHYMIYFHLSWDIMQPITVILANLDILIGYYFFVFKGKQYSLEDIQRNIQQKNKYNYLKRHKFNLSKYQQLLELKQIFQMRLDLLSKSPFVIMDRLEKPIKMLDTR